MENSIFSKKISNHPLFNNVERFVHIVNDNRREGNITLECLVQYIKNGIDVTKSFAHTPIFIVADNIRRKTVYEVDGKTPVTEEYEIHEIIEGVPQYNEDNSPKMITLTCNKTMGLYEYFKTINDLPISTNSQYNTTIEMNDAKGRFDI